MAVDIKTAENIAELARLELTLGIPPEEAPETLRKLTEEFSRIVAYMDILSEIDTEGVEPLYSPMAEPEKPREDAPPPLELRREKAEKILELSPLVSGRFFIVPKVL